MELLDDLGLVNNHQIRQPQRKHYLIYATMQFFLFLGLYAAVNAGIVAYYVEVLETKEGMALCGLIIFVTILFYHFTITFKTRLRLLIWSVLGIFGGFIVSFIGTSLIIDIDVLEEHELIIFCLWLGYVSTTSMFPFFANKFRKGLMKIEGSF